MEKTEQKKYAIKFLKKLGVMKEVIDGLEKDDVKYYSERQDKYFDGVLYYLNNEPDWEAKIEEIEKEYGIYVYHAYHYLAEYGDVLDLLYIPKGTEDAKEAYEFLCDCKKSYVALDVPVYAINLDEPSFSEFGPAGYCVKIGGLSKLY